MILIKKKKIKNLEKKDTLGKLGFDSVIISDFDESLKSVITSLIYTDVSTKRVHFITLNQWFDDSLLKEDSSQNIYFPSINKKNYDNFSNLFFKKFNSYPNQISFLSYDLVGLVYYLTKKNSLDDVDKIFNQKNAFKGETGIFEFKNCTVSVSCKTFGVATTTASGLSLSNSILVFLYSGTLNFFANSLAVFFISTIE